MTKPEIFYTGPIVNVADAKNLGLKRYFTGVPCLHGHVDERLTSNRSCIQCSRSSTKRYIEANYENVRKNQSEYKRINKASIDAYNKMYKVKNKDRYRENDAKWKSDNSEKIKEYRINNRDKGRQYARNRRAALREANGTHTSDDVLAIYNRQNGVCAEPTCGKDLTDGYHVDHIMPLALGGGNGPDNLQCLCPSCNFRKSAKHPIDWARENGRLL